MLELSLHIAVIAGLNLLLLLFAYIYRLYQERGREASRSVREHLEYFHETVAPQLKLDRRRAMQSFSLLAQITLVLTALAIGFASQTYAETMPRAVFETAFFVVLEILIVYQFLPYVLLSRTRGTWLLSIVRILRGFAYAVVPLLLLSGFCISLLHLAEVEEAQAEEPGQAIEELVEEGQERGLIGKEDVPLIASVLQFADKTAREVMTPRPEIVGIAASAPVAELRQLVREKRFSRIPVLGKSLDDIQGVVFVRDLLEVPDQEIHARRVGELMRPVMFVPESKPVVELVRELQREMQHLAVVVDEYGGVAGLITLEDLAEEIIGEINDADQVRRAEVMKESDSSYLVRGGVELAKLREALGIALDAQNATTFAGLVHQWFGYVPKPGETVERDSLRVEVLEATPRRVVRLRVTPLAPAVTSEPAKPKSRKRSPAR